MVTSQPEYPSNQTPTDASNLSDESLLEIFSILHLLHRSVHLLESLLQAEVVLYDSPEAVIEFGCASIPANRLNRRPTEKRAKDRIVELKTLLNEYETALAEALMSTKQKTTGHRRPYLPTRGFRLHNGLYEIFEKRILGEAKGKALFSCYKFTTGEAQRIQTSDIETSCKVAAVHPSKREARHSV